MGGTIRLVLPTGGVELRVTDWSMWRREHPRYPDEGKFEASSTGDQPAFVDTAVGAACELVSPDGAKYVFDGMVRVREVAVDGGVTKAAGTFYATSPLTMVEPTKLTGGTSAGSNSNARRRSSVPVPAVDTGRPD